MLCSKTQTKNPAAEAPVNIKSFLSFPSIFCTNVKPISTLLNITRIAEEIIIKVPLTYPLNAGIKIIPIAKTKTATNK